MLSVMFLLMFLIHVIMDFNVQGWLAQSKKKTWWEVNEPDPLYKHDWKVCLAVHSMSWSVAIMLPYFYRILCCMSWSSEVLREILIGAFTIIVPINGAIHMYVDDAKCNKHLINLRYDQVCHLLQIATTVIICEIFIACAS